MEITVTIAFPVIKVSIFVYAIFMQDGCLVALWTGFFQSFIRIKLFKNEKKLFYYSPVKETHKACIEKNREQKSLLQLLQLRHVQNSIAHTLVYVFILILHFNERKFLRIIHHLFQVHSSQFAIHLCCSGNLHLDNDAYPIQIRAPSGPGFLYFYQNSINKLQMFFFSFFLFFCCGWSILFYTWLL